MKYAFVRITETENSPLMDDAFAIMIHIDENFRKKMNQIHNRCVPLFLEDNIYSVNFFDNSPNIVSQDFLVEDKTIFDLMTEKEFLDFIFVDEEKDFFKPNYLENFDSCIMILKKNGIMWRISSTDLCSCPFETETIPWHEILCS